MAESPQNTPQQDAPQTNPPKPSQQPIQDLIDAAKTPTAKKDWTGEAGGGGSLIARGRRMSRKRR